MIPNLAQQIREWEARVLAARAAGDRAAEAKGLVVLAELANSARADEARRAEMLLLAQRTGAALQKLGAVAEQSRAMEIVGNLHEAGRDLGSAQIATAEALRLARAAGDAADRVVHLLARIAAIQGARGLTPEARVTVAEALAVPGVATKDRLALSCALLSTFTKEDDDASVERAAFGFIAAFSAWYAEQRTGNRFEMLKEQVLVLGMAQPLMDMIDAMRDQLLDPAFVAVAPEVADFMRDLERSFRRN